MVVGAEACDRAGRRLLGHPRVGQRLSGRRGLAGAEAAERLASPHHQPVPVAAEAVVAVAQRRCLPRS